eukprot:10101348-Karenia_brevis.AAC.1
MAQQLTDRFYSLGLQWKPSSLEFLTGGTLQDSTWKIAVKTPHGEELIFKQVEQLIALGASLDSVGSTSNSVEHRLSHADA